MKSSSRVPSASALSVYGLLAAGALALVSVSLPGGSLLKQVSPAALVTGTNPIDLPSLAFGGGLLAVGVAAVALGLALLFARVS
ncbi:hypothetical protein [Haloplanus halophilus]|uniref:hypothetical protein n=1 Tax=Haloplanus halophilus TaxID=2949993 RepID=UPI002040BB68|nr:hypothetical protein [Haloplanus sp. GDY1]